MACGSRALAVAVAALAACSAEQALPPPAPAGIEPAIGYSASEVPVTIRGAEFHVRAEQSVEGAEGTRIFAGFRAWLGEAELRDLVRVDAQTLTAIVPAGISGGTHTLVVEGPCGTRGSVPEAYVALSTTPPTLAVTARPERDPVALGEDAALEVTVTNVGPGAMTDVQPNVKRVVDGTRRVPLPPQPAVALAEGEAFTWRYVSPVLEPVTLVYEAKASSVEVVTGAWVSSEKAEVTIHVEAPPSP